jgi:hypothetical protein
MQQATSIRERYQRARKFKGETKSGRRKFPNSEARTNPEVRQWRGVGGRCLTGSGFGTYFTQVIIFFALCTQSPSSMNAKQACRIRPRLRRAPRQCLLHTNGKGLNV